MKKQLKFEQSGPKKLPGKEIACEYDKFGPVRVFDDGNKRYLTFGAGDEQSCIVKATPHILQYDYNRAMALVLLLSKPKNIGILGLGGGTLIHCLLHMLPDATIDVMELRQVVIKLARKYFYLPSTSRLTIHCQDAIAQLQHPNAELWELLFVDLYIDEGLDARQLTEQFLIQVKQVITQEGFVVINALEEYRTNRILDDLFAEHFAVVYECVTKDGNWVLIATDHGTKVDLSTLKSAAKNLSQQLGFNLNKMLKRLQ